MAARDPDTRALIARIGAAERWARCDDRRGATAPARNGLRRRFAAEVDPDGVLPPDELERRVDHAIHAHMMKMSLAAKQARRRAREQRELAEQAEAELAALGGDADDAA